MTPHPHGCSVSVFSVGSALKTASCILVLMMMMLLLWVWMIPEAPSSSWLSNADHQTALKGHATKSSTLAGRWSRLVDQDCGRESTHVRRSCSCVRVPTVGASDALSVGE